MGQRQALYRFFDDAGELLYVGITIDPSARFQAHSARLWWEEVTTITIESHPSRDAVLVAERAAIVSERPRYNVVHNLQPKLIERPTCPACGKDSHFDEPLDRYFHLDGSEPRVCWRALTRGAGETVTWLGGTPVLNS